MTELAETVLEVRFSGEQLDVHGIPIYELGTVFVSIQRMVHKAYLSQEDRLNSGRSPARHEREMLSLQIGVRRHGSDLFGLVPVLADPTTLRVIMQAVDYLIAGLTSYAVGTVLGRVSSESDGSRQMFIGAIYADTVNVVNRIGNVGGCERIEISSPTGGTGEMVTFDASSRDYVRSLDASFYLGAVQTLEGDVFRLYPNHDVVEIRRLDGRRCKVFLRADDFSLVRYSQTHSGRIGIAGRPRFRIGAETRTFSEFEGTTVVLLEEED